jgi:hypothetical protein
LASIARTYDCSPPAISYILGRSRARDATGEGTEQSGIEEPRPVKGHPTDMPAREFINGAPEIGEGAVLPPTAQESDPKDGSDPKPVSAGSESVSNGTAGASEVEVEIAVTEIPGCPAKRDLVAPAQAAPSGTGIRQAFLVQSAHNPNPGRPAGRFTSRCRTTMLNLWKLRTMAGTSPIWPMLPRFSRWGTSNKGLPSTRRGITPLPMRWPTTAELPAQWPSRAKEEMGALS